MKPVFWSFFAGGHAEQARQIRGEGFLRCVQATGRLGGPGPDSGARPGPAKQAGENGRHGDRDQAAQGDHSRLQQGDPRVQGASSKIDYLPLNIRTAVSTEIVL